jgi:hypothetical protein
VCFSPEASFLVGGALIPAGAYCVRSAWAKNPRLLPVAVMPLAFAAQQIAEGVVWLGLHADDPARVRPPALAFLFFALAFWPWWMSVVNAVLDTRPGRRRACVGLAVLTSAWFWLMYLPILTDPESLLTVKVVHHSIFYDYLDLPLFQYAPLSVLRPLYLLSIVVPMALGPKIVGRLPAALLIGSVAVAVTLYEYAFVSVWCFFAAVLAVLLCVMFYRLPARAGAGADRDPVTEPT